MSFIFKPTNLAVKIVSAAVVFTAFITSAAWVYNDYVFEADASSDVVSLTTQQDLEAKSARSLFSGLAAGAGETVGIFDSLSSWTDGWGVSPFGSGQGSLGEPPPILNGGTSVAENPMIYISSPKSGSDETGSCTGTLIAPKVVLTAAHCLKSKDTGRLVDLFDVSITYYENGIKKNDALVADRIVHPDFRYARGTALEILNTGYYAADVGLILLDKAIAKKPVNDLAVSTDVMQLSSDKKNTQNIVSIISGFGTTKEMRASNTVPSLNQANVTTVPKDNYLMFGSLRLPALIGMHGLYSEWELAHGSRSMNTSDPNICPGDSGGPIQELSTTRQFGVHSLADPNGSSPTSAICKTVRGYIAPLDSLNRNWIDYQIKIWEADGKRCYPQWQDVSATRNLKTGNCDRNTEPTEGAGKGSDLTATSTGFSGNTPLIQCTLADLDRMAQWNRTHTTEYLRQQAQAAWQQRYDAEYQRLLLIESKGTGSLDSITNYGIRYSLTARAAAAVGPQPETSQIHGTQIDLTICFPGAAQDLARYEYFYPPNMAGGNDCQSTYIEWRLRRYIEPNYSPVPASHQPIPPGHASYVACTVGPTNHITAFENSYPQCRNVFHRMNRPNICAQDNQLTDEANRWYWGQVNLVLDAWNNLWTDLANTMTNSWLSNYHSNYASNPTNGVKIDIQGIIPTDGRTSGNRNYNVAWSSNSGQRYNVVCSIPQRSWSAGSAAIQTYALANCMPP